MDFKSGGEKSSIMSDIESDASEEICKEIKLQLHIMNVHFPVKDEMPLQVIWTRGTNQAKTKKIMLSATVQDAIIDEKFEISTMFENDPLTKKLKPKMSFLTVITESKHWFADKVNKGHISKVELDISLFDQDEHRLHRI